jgi:serine/threonine protein kinase
VYKARDLDTRKIVALKKVRFDNMERDSVRFMAREIIVLRRLDHPSVIKLEGLVTSRMSCSLYLVFEYMDHDLAGLASRCEIAFSEPQVLLISILENYKSFFPVHLLREIIV